ncbi:MAG TPA: preprotein translocase subunit YajC [Gemmatimonadaceae bacterium]|nr:preprotein translocase subunit YajC [Gemmatimonadaceae bacterium]
MTHLPIFPLLLLQAAPGGGMPVFLLQMVAIFAIFYFLMIRPQQKQRREHESRLKTLKRGDQIVTAGGIVGEIVAIKETVKDGAPVVSMEDWITIKSGESRLVVERARIAKVLAPTVSGAAPATGTK